MSPEPDEISVIAPTSLPRPPVSEPIKQAIREAFAIVPEGKRSAVVGIADIGTGRVRLHVAWRAGENWHVGGQVGFGKDQKPDGVVYVVAAW